MLLSGDEFCTKVSMNTARYFTFLILALSLAFPAHAEALREALRERIEQLRAARDVQVDGESIAAPALVAAFYEQRDFRPAWTPARENELVALVEGSKSDGLDPSDYHLDALRAGDDDGVDRELLCTDSLIRLAYSLYFGKLDPRRLDPEWNFARTLDGIDPPRALEAMITAPSLGKALYAYAPQMPEYRDLRLALARYRALRAAGGWQAIPPGPTLRPGSRRTEVAMLRSRLALSGDLRSVSAPDPDLYDAALEKAVMRFQRRHGLDPDGLAGRRTRAELDVGVQARIDQIRVNLERLRWVAQNLKGDYLLVDIAGFRARLVLDGKTAWSSRVVVGQPFRSTPVFRATMKYIVLNPTWNVPPTILEKDIVPKVAQDPGFLARHHMRVLSLDGREIDPSTVEWKQYVGGTLPYQIVQVPGDDNPLGRIKFMFPNEHDVYLHDTPAHSLFLKSTRAFSSGCIRVEHPIALALSLLDDPSRWNDQTLSEVITRGETHSIFIKRQVPVLLLYWTAVADQDGVVAFKPDLYGRDAAVLRGLDGPFRFSPPSQ
jgi:murein L,D-transpeptidase YcbB/YkuD